MLLIPCPWCGDCDESEFAYGGAAEHPMPALDGQTSREAWHAHVHLRDNPQGPHREFWHHTSGCERWLIVERDTRTHRAAGARDAGIDPGKAT